MINLDRENYHYYEEYGEEIFESIQWFQREDFEDIVEDDIIVLDDSYRKAKRNIDYIERPDETFSRNHLVYEKRGFVGFSDFSIVGKEFEESGFAPTVIAIHIMYFGIREEVKIHHFVSERHKRYSDLARKFRRGHDSVDRVGKFSDIPKTIGLNQLIECYEMGKISRIGRD